MMTIHLLARRALSTAHKLRAKGFFWATRRTFAAIKEWTSGKHEQRHEASNEYVNIFDIEPLDTISTIQGVGNKRMKINSAQVEITRFCNLRCPGCLLTIETDAGTWSAEHMNFEDFVAICDHLPAAKSLRIFNFGEPSLHPKYAEMIRHAKGTGKFDNIVSTSNLLSHTPEYYSDLFNAGLDSLSVSVDSFDPDIAEKLRTRTKVDKLIKNLEHLIQTRPEQINISTVVSQINLDDLENTFSRLDEMAKNSRTVILASPMAFSDYFATDQAKIVVDTGIINKKLTKLQRRFLNLNIILLSDEENKPSGLCRHPWTDLIVNVKGEISACSYHQETVVCSQACGYLKDQSYEKIVSSPAMIEFFVSYLKKSPDFCSKCPRNFPR